MALLVVVEPLLAPVSPLPVAGLLPLVAESPRLVMSPLAAGSPLWVVAALPPAVAVVSLWPTAAPLRQYSPRCPRRHSRGKRCPPRLIPLRPSREARTALLPPRTRLPGEYSRPLPFSPLWIAWQGPIPRSSLVLPAVPRRVLWSSCLPGRSAPLVAPLLAGGRCPSWFPDCGLLVPLLLVSPGPSWVATNSDP